jgi:hypothetical protein
MLVTFEEGARRRQSLLGGPRNMLPGVSATQTPNKKKVNWKEKKKKKKSTGTRRKSGPKQGM